MATTTTIYGQLAYEGFARAIGSKLGLNVKVASGSNACINAKGVITLPGMSTYQTAQQFTVTCGVLIHEMAHQFYKSHDLIDPKRDKLEHDCLNAVLDVADETWIGEWFTRNGNIRPADLLEIINNDAINQNFAQYCDWQNPASHAWKILCIGIFSARVPTGYNRRSIYRLRRYADQQASQAGVDAKACWRLIKRAIRQDQEDPTPTASRFPKLLKLAKKIAAILQPFAAAHNAGGPSLDGGGTGPLDKALGAGSKKMPKGATDATAIDGAEAAENAIGGTGAGSGGNCGYERNASSATFDLIRPAVQRVAQRIATDGDGALLIDGLNNGSSLGQAHRFLTDGQCLARWNISDNAEGVSVAVLLDCSSSMDHQLADCAGLAKAFVLSMKEAGAAKALTFSDTVEDSDDFSHVTVQGGTSTELGIRKATNWLAPRPGKKWIVVITDGAPNDAIATDDACTEASAKGIKILAVGLNCQIKMAGATAVTASDANHLAIELDAAAHLIESN
jgi:hypothetical protein